ncbi:MAG: hypothetical protein IKT40_12285 [Bacilli bacterium]|nr:hypothetical protein [Bacilli bacterium]
MAKVLGFDINVYRLKDLKELNDNDLLSLCQSNNHNIIYDDVNNFFNDLNKDKIDIAPMWWLHINI